jgi:competence protein ComEC
VAAVGVYPALALVAGVLWGTGADAALTPACGVSALACVAAVVTWVRRQSLLTVVSLAIGYACAGAALAADARGQALDSPLRRVLDGAVGGFVLDDPGPGGDHDPISVRAVLLEDAAIRDGFVSLRAHVTAVAIGAGWVDAAGGVSISIGGRVAPERAGEWRAGRAIQAPVSFRRPARYLNDGVPDFERDLALGGTTLFASVKSGLLVDVVRHGSAIHERAARVRIHARQAVARWIAVHDPAAGAIVTAVLIGDRTGLSDEIRERLQAAGTYHVIAISGGNIAILAGLVLLMLMACGIHGRRAALVSIGVLMTYSQVAVAGPSVWRATLMAVLYLAARTMDHRTAAWQAAALAAALMLVAHPLELQDPGFLLTFGATVALIEGARRAEGRRIASHTAVGWLAASVVASLAVEVALVPVSAQVFSRVTSAGVVLNLIAVPMMAVAQVAGLVVVAADSVPWIAAPAGWMASSAAGVLVSSARLVDVFPWLTSRVPPPGMAMAAAYYLSLAFVLLGSRRLQRTGAVAFAVVIALFVADANGWLRRAAPLNSLRLTMFDVGQGEALLLETPAGSLQVDAGGAPFGGGAFDVGARVLAPALWARGIRSVDTLLVTHGDPDHIGGGEVLVREFGFRHLWEGIGVPRHTPSTVLRALAAREGMTSHFKRTGDVMRWGDATIRVLHPAAPDWERPRVRNDDSVVIEVLYGGVALLLTGDISSGIERALVPMLSAAPVRILKVAHHGSRTSTSFELLESWRPQIALISAGRGNSFGHPAPDVVRRLESIGARIYRTDRDGQITVETDGRRVWARTFVGETAKPAAATEDRRATATENTK